MLIILVVALVVLAGVLARPLIHLLYTASRDANELVDLPPGHVDDASRLNLTDFQPGRLVDRHRLSRRDRTPMHKIDFDQLLQLQ